jgi:hypothetical protein
VGTWNVLSLYGSGAFPEGTQQVDRTAVRWLDSVEEDLKTVAVKNWWQNSRDQDQWQAIIKDAKVHHGLQRSQKNRENFG